MSSQSASPPAENILDTRHLSPAEYQRLVERLAWRGQKLSVDRREETRVTLWPDTVVLCQVAHRDPEAPLVQFLVHPRDISVSGLGFFHSQFIHPGATCTLTLVLKRCYGLRINGTVQSCHHIERSVHKISVCFDRPLDLSQYGLERDP